MLKIRATEATKSQEAALEEISKVERGELATISDGAARLFASWWQSPGTVGHALASLASGVAVDDSDLLFDLEASRREADARFPMDDADLRVFSALEAWVKDRASVYVLWFGGSSYALPEARDLERFGTIEDATIEADNRYRCGSTFENYFYFADAERGEERSLTPAVSSDSEMWVWVGDPRETADYSEPDYIIRYDAESDDFRVFDA